MISPAPADTILYEFRDDFAQAVCNDRHDFVALATVPSTFPRFLGANAAQAFPSEFDAGGVVNKARSKIAITRVRPCNSEIALKGPFSADEDKPTETQMRSTRIPPTTCLDPSCPLAGVCCVSRSNGNAEPASLVCGSNRGKMKWRKIANWTRSSTDISLFGSIRFSKLTPESTDPRT